MISEVRDGPVRSNRRTGVAEWVKVYASGMLSDEGSDDILDTCWAWTGVEGATAALEAFALRKGMLW